MFLSPGVSYFHRKDPPKLWLIVGVLVLISFVLNAFYCSFLFSHLTYSPLPKDLPDSLSSAVFEYSIPWLDVGRLRSRLNKRLNNGTNNKKQMEKLLQTIDARLHIVPIWNNTTFGAFLKELWTDQPVSFYKSKQMIIVNRCGIMFDIGAGTEIKSLFTALSNRRLVTKLSTEADTILEGFKMWNGPIGSFVFDLFSKFLKSFV